MDESTAPPTAGAPGPGGLGDLLSVLEELALVAGDDLRGVLLALTDGGGDVSAEAFAAELARRGLLTAFQAGVLARDRGRDLRIGNYVLERPIGAGGMGKVYLARHRTLRREAAIKVVDAAFARDPKVVQRFRLEVEAMARLDHPHLVAAFDAGEVRGRPYVVMEYVDGPDLGRVVKEEGPLPVADAVAAAVQAARGLQEAHGRGIVHRDVKPHNLLRARDGTVKVSDLGLARLVADAGGRGGGESDEDDLQLTRFGAVIGTVFFMAPEQARNSRDADGRSDVYALGCTLYSLLTGKMPYPGKVALDVVIAHRSAPVPSARAVRPEVSAALDALCRRMMAKDPADRPQSMAEVVEAMRSCPLDPGPEDPLAALVLDDRPGLVGPGEAVGREEGPRWPIAAGLGGVAVVVAALALAWPRLRPREEGGRPPAPPPAAGQVAWVTPPGPGRGPDAAPAPAPAVEEAPASAPADPVPAVAEAVEMPTPTTPPVAPVVDLLAPGGPPGERHAFAGHRGDLRAVAVSTDGTLALTGSSDGSARLWDLAGGAFGVGVEVGPIVDAVAFAPDGRRAAIGAATGQVVLIDVARLRALDTSSGPRAPGDAVRALEGHRGAVNGVAFSADGRQVVSCGEDGSVRAWDAETGATVSRSDDHGGAGVWVALPSPDGLWMLTSGRDRRARARGLASGSPVAGPLWLPEGARCAAIAPDGASAVLGGLDGLLRSWDPGASRLRWRVDGGQGRILGVALADGGRTLISAGERDLVLRDAATGVERHRFPMDVESRAVAAVPGRPFAVSAGADGLLRLWALPSPPVGTDPDGSPDAPPTPIGAGSIARLPGPVSILRGADERALVAWLAEVREQGLIPVDLDAGDSLGVALFGGVARPNPGGIPWQCEVIRGDDALDRRLQENAGRQIGLLAFDACADGPDPVNLCLFAPDAADRPKSSWTIGLRADDAVVSAHLDSRRAARQRPTALASYVARDGRRLAIAAAPDDGLPWALHHDLTADRLREVLLDARRRGLLPVSAEAVPVDGSPRFALLLVGGRTPAPFDYDPPLDASSWPDLLGRRRSSGLVPASLSALVLDGRDHLFSLWTRP